MVEAMKRKRCVIALPRIDLTKLQYDENGRIIVLNEDVPSITRNTRTSTITSNAYNELNGQYLDINENSTDFNIHYGVTNKSTDTAITIDDSQSSDESMPNSVEHTPIVKRLLCAPNNSGFSTQTIYHSPPPRTNHFYGSIHSPAETYAIDSAASSSDECDRPPKDGRPSQSPQSKRRRFSSPMYRPIIHIADRQTESSTVFYKTNKLIDSSSSSTSGFDEQSFCSSHSSNTFKTPIKREPNTTIRSYFVTSPDACQRDPSPDTQLRKRRKSTPRKVSPPIIPPNQRTILDMFIKKMSDDAL